MAESEIRLQAKVNRWYNRDGYHDSKDYQWKHKSNDIDVKKYELKLEEWQLKMLSELVIEHTDEDMEGKRYDDMMELGYSLEELHGKLTE